MDDECANFMIMIGILLLVVGILAIFLGTNINRKTTAELSAKSVYHVPPKLIESNNILSYDPINHLMI